MDALIEGFNQAWTAIARFTPKLIAGLVILLIGWLVATLVRGATRKLLGRLPVNEWLRRMGVSEGLRINPVAILAGILYWLILFITFQLTAQAMGATAFVDALQGVIAFIPQLLIAIAILAVAAALGSFVADALGGTAAGDTAGRAARWALIIFGAFAALNQLGVSPEIVNALFYALLVVVGGAALVAFGVGGIPVARDLTRRWSARFESSPSTQASPAASPPSETSASPAASPPPPETPPPSETSPGPATSPRPAGAPRSGSPRPAGAPPSGSPRPAGAPPSGSPVGGEGGPGVG